MEKAIIQRELADLIFGYLQAGSMSKSWLGDQLAPAELPDQFHHYDRLADLHFILHPVVVSFAKDLRPKLRGIKTETEREKNRSRDEIEGRIDWQLTYQQRNQEAPQDQTLFVTERRTQAYAIPENLVLKKLLSVIYNNIRGLETVDYDWLDARWGTSGADPNHIEEFKSLYDRNIHLNRIPDPEGRLPTDRMVQQTKSSRQEIYQNAAQLLEWRDKLQEGSQRALEHIFESTIIQPSESTLFELFTVLQLLRALETRFDERSKIHPITTGRRELATLGEPPCYLYHDTAATGRGLSFPTRVPSDTKVQPEDHQNVKTEEEWSARTRAIGNWMEVIRAQHSGATEGSSGRPDATVFRPASKNSDQFADGMLIVEVKHSNRTKKIDEGIVELLRYLAYATKKRGDQFLFPSRAGEDAFGGHVHGLLVIDDDSPDEEIQIDGPITIVQASNLKQRLPRLLANVFGSTL